MNHRTNPRFWGHYDDLLPETQRLADENFELLKRDERHPSLRLKRVGRFWSVRVGSSHRALAVQEGGNLVWFWIGRHDEYDRLVQRS